MNKMLRKSGFVLAAATASTAAIAQFSGPSTTTSPYLLPLVPGARTISVLTVGDSVNLKPDGTPYKMVGIPDGLGAFKTGEFTFDLLMNHEIGATQGIVRRHGQIGSFVSRWRIDVRNLQVLNGEDLIQSLETLGSTQLNRLCSADLAGTSAYFDAKTGKGIDTQIFLSGEESGAEGRPFAHVVDLGISYELTSLGNCSWENLVANPATGENTLVASTDDSTPGQVYFYIGQKKSTGSVIDMAGLTGGILYGIRIPGVSVEDRDNGINGEKRFELASLGDVSGKTGAEIQIDSQAAGVTEFLRPEDGCWDPSRPTDFYFVTTDRFNTEANPGRSRLWRLRFTSINHPELGGKIEMLLDGTEGQQMMDNMTIDRNGNLLLQEDPGGTPYLAKVWQYNIKNDTMTAVLEHDSARFIAGAPGFLTQDEESSGIIDATELLGSGWFLLDVQAHYNIAGELVQGGQLLAFYNPGSDSSKK